MAEILKLEVVTPERRAIQTDASEVQLPGSDGYLGILPEHAPLLTELGTGELSYQAGGTTFYIAVFGGYAEVLPDRVIALAEAVERPEEIDVERARTAKQVAEKILATPNISLEEATEAAAEVVRADLRVQVASRAAHSVAAGGGEHSHA